MERSTRGTGVLRLFTSLRLEPGGSGPEAVRTRVILSGGLTTPGSVYESWLGGHEECLRRTRGDAAGTQSGSYSVERTTVNTGTVPNLASPSVSNSCRGWAHRPPIGPGRGGAAVVLRGRESRPHGEGRQRYREGKDAAMPEDALPNGGAQGPRARVLEMQTKLHRWTVADPGRRFDDLFNFVHDPATLLVAFDRVAGNRGATSAAGSPLPLGSGYRSRQMGSNCSRSHRSRSAVTDTGPAQSPVHGTLRTPSEGRDRGERVALRGARRVRREVRRNGPGAIPAPRSGPTQRCVHAE